MSTNGTLSSSPRGASHSPSPDAECVETVPTTGTSASDPPQSQLHIDTTAGAAISSSPMNLNPLRSFDRRSLSFNDGNPSDSGRTPSILSQRSDAPRVRFSSDVQTIGERNVVSPSITVEEALSRLQQIQSSQTTFTRRDTPEAISDVPDVPSTSSQPNRIKGILRSPLKSSGKFLGSVEQIQQRRPIGRPRGWSFRRPLVPKSEPSETPSNEIGLSDLSTDTLTGSKMSALPERIRSTFDDSDSIHTVTPALEEAGRDKTSVPMQSKTSSAKKPAIIEPDVTQASLPFYSSWASSHRTRSFVAQKCKEIISRIKRLRDPRLISQGKGREIPINVFERGIVKLLDERTGREYINNLITSSRYTIYSFLPRQIWAQFSKIANLYHLPFESVNEVTFWL